MSAKKMPGQPSEIGVPSTEPEIMPDREPANPLMPEEEPEIEPDEDPEEIPEELPGVPERPSAPAEIP